MSALGIEESLPLVALLIRVFGEGGGLVEAAAGPYRADRPRTDQRTYCATKGA